MGKPKSLAGVSQARALAILAGMPDPFARYDGIRTGSTDGGRT